MDLGNAFQVILFLLPGFLLIWSFLLFVPQRQATSDTTVIAWSIAATALVWSVASALLVVVEWVIAFFGFAFNQNWHPDLWTAVIQPVLSFKSAFGTVLVTGLVLNVAAAGAGALLAGWAQTERHGIRIFQLRWGPGFVKRLRFDLNPRVWNWFFQGEAPETKEPAEPTSPRTIYRVTLSDRSVLIGEITEYSNDPNDDVVDLIIRGYSVWNNGQWVPVEDTTAALIKRDDILLIESLRPPIDRAPQTSPLLGH